MSMCVFFCFFFVCGLHYYVCYAIQELISFYFLSSVFYCFPFALRTLVWPGVWRAFRSRDSVCDAVLVLNQRFLSFPMKFTSNNHCNLNQSSVFVWMVAFCAVWLPCLCVIRVCQPICLSFFFSMLLGDSAKPKGKSTAWIFSRSFFANHHMCTHKLMFDIFALFHLSNATKKRKKKQSKNKKNAVSGNRLTLKPYFKIMNRIFFHSFFWQQTSKKHIV